MALCRYRALSALGNGRAGREQPGPAVPALSAALRASHPATRAPGTAAPTDTLWAFPPPPSALPAAAGTAVLGLGGNRKITLEESNTKHIPASGCSSSSLHYTRVVHWLLGHFPLDQAFEYKHCRIFYIFLLFNIRVSAASARLKILVQKSAETVQSQEVNLCHLNSTFDDSNTKLIP